MAKSKNQVSDVTGSLDRLEARVAKLNAKAQAFKDADDDVGLEAVREEIRELIESPDVKALQEAVAALPE